MLKRLLTPDIDQYNLLCNNDYNTEIYIVWVYPLLEMSMQKSYKLYHYTDILYHQVGVGLAVTSRFENVPLLTSQVGVSP